MGIFDSLKRNIMGESIEEVDDNTLYPIENEIDEIDRNNASAREPMSTGAAIELKVVKPERYANVKQIADHLLNHRTVVLNLEATNKETAKRLLDFLSGVAYSIDGQLKRVASNTFVITPANVDVSGDQMRPASATDDSQNKFTTTYGLSSASEEEPEAAPSSDTIY
ncbi:MAG: cell division protein SepF [Clostridia bacterium]|nr:cell division protein SepF [Clostridia bacterium]